MSTDHVMTPEEFDKYLDEWCNDERVVAAYRVAHRALADATQRAETAERFIADEGYRRCDVMRCNCGSWHAAEGWYARFRDIENATQEDWQNGETLIARVKRIVSERDAALASPTAKGDEGERRTFWDIESCDNAKAEWWSTMDEDYDHVRGFKSLRRAQETLAKYEDPSTCRIVRIEEIRRVLSGAGSEGSK